MYSRLILEPPPARAPRPRPSPPPAHILTTPIRYMPSDPHFFFDSDFVPFAEKDPTALAASVIGKGGGTGNECNKRPYDRIGNKDGRVIRGWLLKNLTDLIGVHNYGDCLHNTPWPIDLVSPAPKFSSDGPRSKRALLRRHKFCIAFENAEDPGYATEKLADCLVRL